MQPFKTETSEVTQPTNGRVSDSENPHSIHKATLHFSIRDLLSILVFYRLSSQPLVDENPVLRCSTCQVWDSSELI